jgi:hypothetical protein
MNIKKFIELNAQYPYIPLVIGSLCHDQPMVDFKMDATAGAEPFAKRLSWLVVDRVQLDYRNLIHRKARPSPKGQETRVQV